MRIIFTILTALILTTSMSPETQAKNYSHRAKRPTTPDHTWSGYDYNFNVDENGYLTGTNVFVKVYNTTPTRRPNAGHDEGGTRMCTGYESLAITVLPGFYCYRCTLKTAVVEWQWDAHQSKWVRRPAIISNGVRSFLVKDGIVDGGFEIPVAADLFGAHIIRGVSKDGILPSGSSISWVIYDYSKDAPTSITKIKSKGTDNRMNIENYMADVLKEELTGSFGSDENGTWVKLRFPIVGETHDLLPTIGNLTGTSSILDAYNQVTLPDVFFGD